MLGLSPVATASEGDEPPAESHKLPPAVDELFRWLPTDTESVMVAQGPFAVLRSPSDGSERTTSPTMHDLRLFALGLFIPMMVSQEALNNEKVVVGIIAARRFRSPGDIGPALYDGAALIRFDKSAHDRLDEVVSVALTHAERRIHLAGIEVAAFTRRIDANEWTFFVARPEPDILIQATDRAFLEALLERKHSRPEDRALPATLPEWKHVDVNSSLWALHHYQHPRRGHTLPAEVVQFPPDREAIGFTVSWRNTDSTPSIRYLSRAGDPVKAVKDAWTRSMDDEKSPGFTEVEPNVVDISFRDYVSGARGRGLDSPLFLFIIAGLGHVIF